MVFGSVGAVVAMVPRLRRWRSDHRRIVLLRALLADSRTSWDLGAHLARQLGGKDAVLLIAERAVEEGLIERKGTCYSLTPEGRHVALWGAP